VESGHGILVDKLKTAMTIAAAALTDHHSMMFDNKSRSSHLPMMDIEDADIENFTQDLHNHCRMYRSKLDEWIDGQMASCNAAVERHNASAAIHQGRLDQTMQTLLAWQLQDGLTININNSSNSKTNEKRREMLRQKQLQVQDELDGLQAQLDKKKTYLQGTYDNNNFFRGFCTFVPWHFVRSPTAAQTHTVIHS
jgi:hypothetical protein